MDNRFDSLPANIQKLVKKLADLQREQIAVMRNGDTPANAKKMDYIFKRCDQAIEELFSTKFANEEIGVCFPDDLFYSDDLMEIGEYFLGIYAVERLTAEENGEKYDEDLFYAGALLRQRAAMAVHES